MKYSNQLLADVLSSDIEDEENFAYFLLAWHSRSIQTQKIFGREGQPICEIYWTSTGRGEMNEVIRFVFFNLDTWSGQVIDAFDFIWSGGAALWPIKDSTSSHSMKFDYLFGMNYLYDIYRTMGISLFFHTRIVGLSNVQRRERKEWWKYFHHDGFASTPEIGGTTNFLSRPVPWKNRDIPYLFYSFA